MANNESPLILVADDEPSTLALVGNHLRARGYRVIEAADGDEAWDLCTRELPDLVVLDVMMPGMSGWEVCRRVREAVSLAHTGVIMLTGIGDTLNELTSPLYGADVYMDKPFQFAKLLSSVEETLDKRSKGDLGRPEVTSGPSDPALAAPAAKGRPKKAKARITSADSSQEGVVTSAAPVEAPKAKKAPAKKAPAKKAPAKKAPAKKAPAKKAPAKKAPAKKAPAKKAPAKKAPAKKAPAKKAPAKKAPAKKAPAKKAPAKKAPAKKAPAKKAPAKKAPAKKAPAKKGR